MRLRLLLLLAILLMIGASVQAQPVPEPIENPQVVDWIAPSGSVTPAGNPLYQWNAAPGATSYLIYLSVYGNGTYGPGKFLGTIPSSFCDADDVCSVDLTTQTNQLPGATAWLTTGSYAVFINAGSAWEGPFIFSVTTPPPAPITFAEATGTVGGTPTINWTLDGDAAYAAFFQFYIAPALNLAGAALPGGTQWVSRQDACGGSEGTTCSWTPSINWQTATRYSIYAQSWGAGGLSVGGLANSGWVTTDINIGGPPPAPPSNVDFAVVNFVPTVTWDDDPNTTSYNIAVLFPNGFVFADSFQKAEADCNGTTCEYQVIPPPGVQVVPGEYRIYVQPVGPGGTASGGINNLGWFEVYTFTL